MTVMVWCDGLIPVFCYTSKKAASYVSASPVGLRIWTLPLFVELGFSLLFYFCTSFECVMDLHDFYLKGSYVCLYGTYWGPF